MFRKFTFYWQLMQTTYSHSASLHPACTVNINTGRLLGKLDKMDPGPMDHLRYHASRNNSNRLVLAVVLTII